MQEFINALTYVLSVGTIIMSGYFYHKNEYEKAIYYLGWTILFTIDMGGVH